MDEILNYQIIRKIGEGGMGVVYLAKNKSIHQLVAIKALRKRYSSNPELRNRFRQEAIMLSNLNHPNIVRFLNYVENENGVFLIMDYVEGMTLEDYLGKKTGLLVEDKAIPLMDQILDAFAYAHEHKMVHRDIKPSNIIVTKDGHIKILDFGIAQIISESAEHSNSDGTPAYMSPEQVHNRPVDIRSDIYSLGVVFYQMLTGTQPYDMENMSELDLRNAIANEPLKRMKETYPYVSDNMQKVVDHATDKDPERRYASCREIQRDLKKIAFMAAHGGKPPRRKKKSSGFWWYAAAIIIALLITAFGIWGYDKLVANSTKLYYADYREKFGLPEGIDNVETLEGGGSSYLITLNADGKPERMTLVDANNKTQLIADTILSQYKPVDTEFIYDNKGKLDHKRVYDSRGRLMYRSYYNDDATKVRVVPAKGDTVTAGRQYRLKYDGQGRIAQLLYTDSVGGKKSRNGVFGESYTYDKAGHLSRITYLDSLYNPGEDIYGVGIIAFNYKGGLQKATSTKFDKGGLPLKNKPRSSRKADKNTKGSKNKNRNTDQPKTDNLDNMLEVKKAPNKSEKRIN